MKRKLSVGLVVLVLVMTVVSSLNFQALYADTPQTFVGYHGQLKVQGNQIVDARDQVITLRGMSLYAWNTNGLQFYNETTVKRLVEEWKCTVIRIPILPKQVSSQESLVKKVVDACIANGVYAIIDWHSMTGANAEACSDFMKRMATAYGNTPNVMYETWNEPESKDTWSNVKTYHQNVITAIRSIDTDNIIICGTPQWAQKPQEAAADPITTSTNIAYSMHFYAATHKQWLRDDTTTALNKGIAIFASEYGTGAADGNGSLDAASTQEWWNYMDANNIGSANWSISALSETTAAFNSGTSGTDWNDSNLKPSGILVKNYLVKMNTPLWDEINNVQPTSMPTPTGTLIVKGDIDENGSFNSIDFGYLRTHLLGSKTLSETQLKAADVDGNSAVNSIDFGIMRQVLLGIKAGF
ncbi:cellulase family glycosylhydrolase [Acetivibrio cellulolyticus]|uniref:cellulase family glycosylhydrolase n=1 Tax=Acetivibrio cellulolyticus TaxID=35830 RepID=UPI0001E2C21C|nr:cellulase family glycosylhydrolase [Acetivibrio cellulolyticus]